MSKYVVLCILLGSMLFCSFILVSFLCISDSEIAFVYSSVTNHCLLNLPVCVLFLFAMSMNSFPAVIASIYWFELACQAKSFSVFIPVTVCVCLEIVFINHDSI